MTASTWGAIQRWNLSANYVWYLSAVFIGVFCIYTEDHVDVVIFKPDLNYLL